MRSKPKAIFFDLDGTIIDSIELIIKCFQHAVVNHLHYTPDRQEILRHIGIPLITELERLAPGQGEVLLGAYREMWFELHDKLVSVYPGIKELIEDIHQRDIMLGVVTSKAKLGTERALKLLGETALIFKTVVSVEDVKNHKPHPEPLLFAAASIDVKPEECWYIGDTVHDMRSALSAEMTPIGVTWGVESGTRLKELTEYVATSTEDILSWLERLTNKP